MIGKLLILLPVSFQQLLLLLLKGTVNIIILSPLSNVPCTIK